MAQTLGQYLFDSALPQGLKFTGPITAKSLQSTLEELARSDPATYVKTVTELKHLGDEVATVEGISVGLDDIEPYYAGRNPITKKALEKIKKTKDPAERRKLILEAQDAVRKVTLNHPGDMALMARSGGRGSVNQLMKTVTAPVGASNYKGETVPWLIHHSYSEGLRPGEYWVAGDEARQNVVEGKTQVTEPGEVGKLMIDTMIDHVISGTDCGTHNGITASTDDKADLVDRFLARETGGFQRNRLLDSQTIDALQRRGIKHVVVRSPMTCTVGKGGVCQMCMGLTPRGKLHVMGQNVGVRAAQAMSEPLTQMTISAKHGTRLVRGEAAKLKGLDAIKQFLNVPKSFLYAATLAQHDGTVTKIEAAPQGGSYIYVDKTREYVPPDLNIMVHEGQKVEAGDALSDGIPRPDEVVRHKGMGVGRKYLVDRLHGIYQGEGIDLDKRHLELLAKAQLNFVEVEDDPHDEFKRTDVINFNKVRHRLTENSEEIPLDKATDRLLAEDYLQWTAGTRLTPSVISQLSPHFKSIKVTTDPLKFKFVMHPLERTPLLREDWLARLAHRYLQNSVLQGAHFAQTSDVHGYHPVPGYVHGLEFGNGSEGAY